MRVYLLSDHVNEHIISEHRIIHFANKIVVASETSGDTSVRDAHTVCEISKYYTTSVYKILLAKFYGGAKHRSIYTYKFCWQNIKQCVRPAH